MMWIVLIALLIVTVLVIYGCILTVSASRRRSAHWDNLQARGKLMRSQMARLSEVAAQRKNTKPDPPNRRA